MLWLLWSTWDETFPGILLPAWLCVKLEIITMTMLEEEGSFLRLQRDHTMQVKEKHYEKVGEDIEHITRSYQKHHPAWVEGW